MKNRIKEYNTMLLAGIVILFAFSVWKLTLGIHSDEAYLIAIGDMIARGASFFKECWSSLQMSAVISAPFIWIYEKICGGTEGILFFLRLVALIIRAGIAVYFYLVFYKRYNKYYVLAASLMFFMYIPDSPSFSYKEEIVWFSFLGICYSYRYYETLKVRYIILLGLTISANVLSYPTTILIFPLYLFVLYWIQTKKNEVTEKRMGRHLAVLSITCCVCAIFFLITVLSKISLKEFIEYFPRALMDKNLNTSYGRKLLHPIIKFLMLGVMILIPLVICAKVKWLNEIVKKYHVPIVCILLISAYVMQCYIERRCISWHCITYPYSLTVFLIPALCYIRRKMGYQDGAIMVLFEIPAVMQILCIALASNQGNITSMYGTIVSTIGFVLMLGDEENTKKVEKSYLLIQYEKKCISIVLFFMSLSTYVIMVYEQESVSLNVSSTRTIFTERTYVDYGPARGMKLGEEIYQEYIEVCQTVDEVVTEQDIVMVNDNYMAAPFGYLCSRGNYGVYSPQREWELENFEYFEMNPDRRPTVILIDMSLFESDSKTQWEQSVLDAYILSHNYIWEKNIEPYVIYRLNDENIEN